MDWIKLLTAYGLGFVTLVAIEYGLAKYRKYFLVEEESPEDDEDEMDDDSSDVIRILESILFMDMEYDGVTIVLARTEIAGLNAVKIVFHEYDEDAEEEFDVIHYAIVDGLEVSLVTPAQWAFVLGEKGVRSIPTMEDLDDIEGFFDADGENSEDQ